MPGKRLKEFRESLDLGQEKFVEKLGLKIKQQVYSNYETGVSNIPNELLIAIAEVFNGNINWIMTGMGDKYNASVALSLNEKTCIEQKDNVVWIERVNAKVSAGSGIENFGFESVEIVPFLKRLLAYYSPYLPNRLKIIEVSGNSMQPLYEHGDLAIYIDGLEAKTDDIYVINRNGELMLKQVQWDGRDLVLISKNPDYPPKRISSDSQDNVTIIGRVIGRINVR